jgi:molybdenum-dependent DNA-binding transcriptional regulator ModE
VQKRAHRWCEIHPAARLTPAARIVSAARNWAVPIGIGYNPVVPPHIERLFDGVGLGLCKADPAVQDCAMIDWDDVRHFLAVARGGSVRAAAERLGVNHSTVLRRIANLDERLGVHMFEKLPSGYRLTAAGEEVLEFAEHMEASSHQLETRVFGRDQSVRGLLRVTLDCGEEVCSASVVTSGDAPKVFQPTKHAFDRIPVAVEEWREAGFPFTIGFGRDVRHRAEVFNLSTDRVGVVAFVCVQDVALWKLLEQRCARGAIGDLAPGQHEGERTALSIGQRVDLGRAAAPRAADGLIFLPPFPPAAERWALTAELSIRTCADGPPACASAWNKFIQTPFSAHRTKRL